MTDAFDDDRPAASAPAASSPAAPPAPPPALVRSPLSDGQWHRLHPLTPLLRGGLVLIVVIGIVVTNLRDRLAYVFLPWLVPELDSSEWDDWDGGDPIDFIIANNLYVLVILGVLVVLLLLVGWFYLSWRFHQFRITGDVVEVRSGILFRTQRRAPLDRVQGVNLTRPMIARIFGMAKLEVVGAGADANVKLEYLSTANAEAVRADILRLASGQRLAEAGASAPTGSGAPVSRAAALSGTVSRGITGLIEGDDLAAEEPASVVHIPTGRLIASHIISPSLVWLLAAIGAITFGVINATPWLLFGFLPAFIAFGAYWVSSIIKSLRYAIAPTRDGVRITYGLLTTVTEIVPPGRVHAVEVTQSIMWRPFGWWRIRINRLTGRSAADTSTDQFTTALPVGTAADVDRVLRLLLPRVPEQEWPDIVGAGLTGTGDAAGFTTTPGRARIIRLLSWRRNGFRLLPDALLLRRGLLWRKLAILPLARLQSIGVYQGPVDRMLRVAAVRGHVVAGPIYPNVSAIDRDQALGLFEEVARAAVAAAASDRTHRWAQDAEAPAAGAAPGSGVSSPVESAQTAADAAGGSPSVTTEGLADSTYPVESAQTAADAAGGSPSVTTEGGSGVPASGSGVPSPVEPSQMATDAAGGSPPVTTEGLADSTYPVESAQMAAGEVPVPPSVTTEGGSGVPASGSGVSSPVGSAQMAADAAGGSPSVTTESGEGETAAADDQDAETPGTDAPGTDTPGTDTPGTDAPTEERPE